MAHGIPPEIAEALDKQVEERLKGGAESRVDLSTHQLFNVKPTTFLEFAQRNAEAFGLCLCKNRISRCLWGLTLEPLARDARLRHNPPYAPPYVPPIAREVLCHARSTPQDAEIRSYRSHLRVVPEPDIT